MFPALAPKPLSAGAPLNSAPFAVQVRRRRRAGGRVARASFLVGSLGRWYSGWPAQGLQEAARCTEAPRREDGAGLGEAPAVAQLFRPPLRSCFSLVSSHRRSCCAITWAFVRNGSPKDRCASCTMKAAAPPHVPSLEEPHGGHSATYFWVSLPRIG